MITDGTIVQADGGLVEDIVQAAESVDGSVADAAFSKLMVWTL